MSAKPPLGGAVELMMPFPLPPQATRKATADKAMSRTIPFHTDINFPLGVDECGTVNFVFEVSTAQFFALNPAQKNK